MADILLEFLKCAEALAEGGFAAIVMSSCGAEGNTHHGGGFAEARIAVEQVEDLARRFREGLQRPLKGLFEGVAVQVFSYRCRRRHRTLMAVGQKPECPKPASAAFIEGRSPDDGEEPGFEGSCAFECRPAIEDFQEGLLEDIFGTMAVAPGAAKRPPETYRMECLKFARNWLWSMGSIRAVALGMTRLARRIV